MSSGTRSPREFLDMSSFTDNYSKWELRRKRLANMLAWNVYGGKTEFTAKVLSPPIILSQMDAGAVDGTATRTGDEIREAGARIPAVSSKFAFKARILGDPSPHDFLTDPCRLSTAEEPNKAYRLTALHTTFLSADDPSVDFTTVPKVGDIVRVELDIDDFSYNLQFGRYKGIATNATAGMESSATSDSVSERLADQAREAGADIPDPPLTCFHLTDLFTSFDPSIFAQQGMTVQIGEGGLRSSTMNNNSRTGNAITDLEQQIASETSRNSNIVYGDPHENNTEMTTAFPFPSYTNNVTSFVESEISFWAGKTETDPTVYDRLKAYWEAVGWTENQWTPAGDPWSSAFISYIMKNSGRSDARSSFRTSSAHYRYAQRAYQNRKDGNAGWAAFSLRRDNVFVDVGDIVVKPRAGEWTDTHGDVVYKIENNIAYLAGGNVGHTAKQVGSIRLNSVNIGGVTYERANFPNFPTPKPAQVGPYVVILKYMSTPTFERSVASNLRMGGLAIAGTLLSVASDVLDDEDD